MQVKQPAVSLLTNRGPPVTGLMRINAIIAILQVLVTIYIGNSQAKKILLLLKKQLCMAVLGTGFTLVIAVVFFRLVLMAGISLFVAVRNNDKLTQ